MSSRRTGPLAFLPRQGLARLAALLWLLACVIGAPGAATLHLLSHAAGIAADNRGDTAPDSHGHEQCDLCAAWSELDSALPGTPPVLAAAAQRVLPFAPPAAPTPDASTPHWFHPRAPPIQA